MYLVKFITNTNSNNIIAISNLKTLFELVWILDNSKECIVWNVLDHEPNDFGWKQVWNKYSKIFTEKHFSQCCE